MDKEKYKKRLHELVMQLKEQEPDLFAYLQQEVNASDVTKASDSRIDKIEEYLGLDYKLDDINPAEITAGTLNYTFVDIPSLRNQLNSDFREMMRYRYGTRSHKSDFYEYCKYAHFQLEAMTNYFMEIWSTPDEPEDAQPNIELAKKNIRENWKEKYPITFYDTIKSIEDIPYQNKVKSLLNFINIKDVLISNPQYIYYNQADIVDYIRRTRNACSHRGAQLSAIMNDAIDDFELHKVLRTSATGKTQLYDFSANWDVKYYLWLRSTPWDDVAKALRLFVTTLQAHLE